MAAPSETSSGPAVARAFHRALGLVSLFAWLSLGVQVHVLVGSRGLLPAEPFVALLADRGIGVFDAPALHRLWASDAALTAGVVVGVAASVLALIGVHARPAFAVSTALYLSYVIVGRSFFSFQWDNLLLECGALAVLLPEKERAPWVHLLVRVVLFKLYFESGIAKWQSHLGDWKDGSAMAYYYETAPLPAALAWYAHHAPAAWHRIESWGTLAFELGAPVLIFFGRRPRLVAFAVFATFQVVNLATANYGFFSHLALALQVFLLDDSDIVRLEAWARRVARRPAPAAPVVEPTLAPDGRFPFARVTVATLVVPAWLGISLQDGLSQFAPKAPDLPVFSELGDALRPFRLVNTYHLFGHITRDRVEPEFQVLEGGAWSAFDLHDKPGDVTRAPPYVAPHQPRVDFLLWFYGLASRGPVPPYVVGLFRGLCLDPEAVAPLFVQAPPPGAEAVRVVFFDYRFTTAAEKRETGAWWKRREVGEPRTLACRDAR